LVESHSIEEVTQKTSLPYLDVIVSGPVPPNPSELLISDKMDEFMAELTKKYDYIVMDTPPLVLVSDALDLMKYADASLYVIKQNYTQKNMLSNINEKYQSGEAKNI